MRITVFDLYPWKNFFIFMPVSTILIWVTHSPKSISLASPVLRVDNLDEHHCKGYHRTNETKQELNVHSEHVASLVLVVNE